MLILPFLGMKVSINGLKTSTPFVERYDFASPSFFGLVCSTYQFLIIKAIELLSLLGLLS